MIPIVTPAEMRVIDAHANIPVDQLIERAGWHVARVARTILGGVYGRRVVVIAGPGNNGADARVAARLLDGWGVHVTVVSPDVQALADNDLVIDGAFGTGMNRPYIAPANRCGSKVLAVDSPSGIDGLTGECRGEPLAADHTVTFGALKPGLLLLPGADLASAGTGTIEVVDIGLDTSRARAGLLTAADVASWLPTRSRQDHKWKRSVYVVGGSPGMYGAPLMASRAALRSGAGMVWCGLPGQSPPGMAGEVVFRTLPLRLWHDDVLTDVDRFGAVVLGCGLSADAEVDVRSLVDASKPPVVVDGGAIRALGTRPQLHSRVVLTPHDGEFVSLMGEPPGPDRFAAARSCAETTGSVVLLKGPTTIVASPGGMCLVVNEGDERLATAGTGDVLAGVIGSLLAGGLEPAQAAAAGAWLHGAAGQTQTRHGLVASDLLDGLPLVLGRLLD